MARHCPGAAALGRHLYLTGGSGTSAEANGQGASPTASVERLDMRRVENGWDADIAPMLRPRYRHAVAALDGRLYACGGQMIDGRATATVERYEPATDTWHEVAPMSRPRFSHAAATLNGRLYVLGGFANARWLSAVERYDPKTNQWEELSPLACAVSAPGLATC